MCSDVTCSLGQKQFCRLYPGDLGVILCPSLRDAKHSCICVFIVSWWWRSLKSFCIADIQNNSILPWTQVLSKFSDGHFFPSLKKYKMITCESLGLLLSRCLGWGRVKVTKGWVCFALHAALAHQRQGAVNSSDSASDRVQRATGSNHCNSFYTDCCNFGFVFDLFASLKNWSIGNYATLPTMNCLQQVMYYFKKEMLKIGLEGVVQLSVPRQDQHNSSVPHRCLPNFFLKVFKGEGSTTLSSSY